MPVPLFVRIVMQATHRTIILARIGLLVAIFCSGASFVFAQDWKPLPPIGSAPQQTVLPVSHHPMTSTPAKSESKETKKDGDCSCKEEKKDDKDKKDDKNKCDDEKDEKPKQWWEKVPQVVPMPRPGWFPLPPTGKGFYSIENCLEGEELKGPPKYPYPRISLMLNSFFDADWRYLDDPKNTEHDYFDFLKRQRLGNCGQFLFTTGGEVRARYNLEENSRLVNTGPARLRGEDNEYDLYRVRAYADIFYLDKVRLFAEFISATTPNHHLNALIIDENKADMLNLFMDFNLGEIDKTPVWLRVGRQELLYGSQRLISPIEWANTRRTFQGIKGFWQAEKHNFDAFFVQPVVPQNEHFDSVDNNRVFTGAWYTYKPNKTQAVDLYYLMLDDTNQAYRGRAGRLGGSTINTYGARYIGDYKNFLWEFEGMLQSGSHSNQSLFAGSATAGVGYHFKETPWTPMFWLYYDHASGTKNPERFNGDVNNTFEQLFPFGHYYFGFIDIVGRRNINDINTIITFWPEKWLFCQLQMHHFYLAQARDALYNAAGAPVRRDPTGNSGVEVGHELDLLVNFHVSKHTDFMISYSYMFAGPFLKNTATTSSGQDNPQALYVQYSYRW